VIKQKEILAMLIDQPEKRGAVWVAFFYREESGRSTVKYGRPFDLIRTGTLRTDLVANIQQYMARIEAEVRHCPED
jgi:hypothetical protein